MVGLEARAVHERQHQARLGLGEGLELETPACTEPIPNAHVSWHHDRVDDIHRASHTGDQTGSHAEVGAARPADPIEDPFSLRAHSVPGLLQLYVGVLDRLRELTIVRSANNPVSDYAELLVARALGLDLAPQSVAGFDATASDGTRYQVKGRRPTLQNPSRQLSAIRGLGTPEAAPVRPPFDYLVGVLFDPDFTVHRAAQIPVTVVRAKASWTPHVNGWRFILRDSVWSLPGVIDLTEPVRTAAGE